MSFTRFLCFAAACITLTFAATPASRAADDSSPDAPVTHAELPALVKKALMDNPEMVMEAAQKLRDKQMATENSRAQAALKKDKAELVGSDAPSIGPKDADVTMVEFFDYHCGYCKQLYTSIIKLHDEDKKLRIVFREFPILAPDSETAARTALAVNHIAPDKYFAFYGALMKTAGEKFTDTMLMKTAEEVGISTTKLKAALDDKELAKSFDDELTKNRKMAMDLNIRGTPGIIIGNHLFAGAMAYETLAKVITDVRNGDDAKAEKDSASGPSVMPLRE